MKKKPKASMFVWALGLAASLAFTANCTDTQIETDATLEENPTAPHAVADSTELTLDDIHGQHNPKMIGGWGGEKTHESWFLRCVWSPRRIEILDISLMFYYAQNGILPKDLNELKRSGFYPIGTVDPVDYQPIQYDTLPVADDDFNNLFITSSTDLWLITGQTPKFPSGEWQQYTWEINPPEEYWYLYALKNKEEYPNPSAMKGAFLADCLRFILYDYENRRDNMPQSSVDLLDNLWIMQDDRAEHNPDMEPYEPGSFIFGLDENNCMAAAIWTDSFGNNYSDSWVWYPWPDGWDDLPVAGTENPDELVAVPRGGVKDDYMPSKIIWACSLVG